MSQLLEVLEDVQAPGDNYVESLVNSQTSFDELVFSIDTWNLVPDAVNRWAGNGAGAVQPLPDYITRELDGKRLRSPMSAGERVPKSSSPGCRVLCAILIYLRRFELLGSASDACITDLFDMLTGCLDLLTVDDAKLVADMLWASRLLLEPLFNDGDQAMKSYLADPNIPLDLRNKFTQRIIPGRAMFICVCNGLISILKTDVADYTSLSRMRMLPYLVLPENFEGISNRHRGKEPPSISRVFPATVASFDEEKSLFQEWNKALDYRKTLGLQLGAGVTFNNFILLRRALAFLQDPGEYLAQSLASGGNLPCKIEDLHINGNTVATIADDVLEEGEAVDERQSASMSHKTSDILCKRFRDLEHLGTFLQKRVKTKDNKKKASRLDIQLLTFANTPHSFMELFSELPQVASMFATNIIIALKLHFQWCYGSEASDVSLLSKWSTNITIGAAYAYRRALQSLLPCVSTELLEESNEALGLEAQSLVSKFECIRIPRVVDDLAEPKLPELDEQVPIDNQDCGSNTRLEEFLTVGLDRINVISATSVDDLKSLSLEPADLTAWRADAYIETPLPEDYASKTHEERLVQRWVDVKVKQRIDEDEANEIDEADRFQSSQLNCWRTLRSLALAGIAPLYSYPPDEINDLRVILKMYE